MSKILNVTERYAQETLEALFAQADVDLDPPHDRFLSNCNLTKFILELNPRAHVGHVSNILQASGAITVLKKGAGGRGSELKINRRFVFQSNNGEPLEFDQSSWSQATPAQQLAQQHRLLAGRVYVLEKQVEELQAAIQELFRLRGPDLAMQHYGPPPDITPNSDIREPLTDEQKKAILEGISKPLPYYTDDTSDEEDDEE